MPSIGILLHEMIKLMYHARCKDPIFIRLGTCGGIGVEGGTVVVTDESVDGLLRNSYEMVSPVREDFPLAFSNSSHSLPRPFSEKLFFAQPN